MCQYEGGPHFTLLLPIPKDFLRVGIKCGEVTLTVNNILFRHSTSPREYMTLNLKVGERLRTK